MRLCAGVSFPATECSVIVAVGDGVWMLEISALAADGDSVMSAAMDNFDVEFDDVDEGVELNVDDAIFWEHEADEHDLGRARQ